MALYEKFTYDLGKLTLTKKDKTELEAEFDGSGEYLVCSDATADEQVKADFLAGETGLPSEAFSCMQEKMSEDCN